MKRFILVFYCVLCLAAPAWADDAPKLPDEFFGVWVKEAWNWVRDGGIQITPGGHIEWMENAAFNDDGSPDKPKVFEQDTYQVIAVSQTEYKDIAYLLVKHGDIPRRPFWDPRRPYWYVELIVYFSGKIHSSLELRYLDGCGESEDAWNNIQQLRDLMRTNGPCERNSWSEESFYPFIREP